MKRPWIEFFTKLRENWVSFIASLMPAFSSHSAQKRRAHLRIKNFGLYTVTILSLVACQPSLWGAPPPPPTAIVPTLSATLTFPASTATLTAMPPTAAPTPVVLNAAQVWAAPSVPSALQNRLRDWGFQVITGDQGTANLYVDVVQPVPGAMHVSEWTYALVAPFPTLSDGVKSQDILSSWAGTPSGPFAGIPLLMEESTLQTFSALWGPPAQGAVQVAPVDELQDTAWNAMPTWAIIPFEQIEPTWKVLKVDGQSPIEKRYDPQKYPLDVSYRLMCVNPCQLPGEPQFSFQNYDPHKLATVIMTGVTAMTRATARTMDVKGITYPGEVLRDIFLEADIMHINNEVPFY